VSYQHKDTGVFAYTGTIHARAYSHPKDTYGSAISALKADLSKSLAVRFDFLCEELERREAEIKQSKRKKAKTNTMFNPFSEAKCELKFQQSWGLPRRVFFPFVKPLLIADFVLPFETIRDDCCERAKDLLSLQPTEEDFVTPESFTSADHLYVELASASGADKEEPTTVKEDRGGIEIIGVGPERDEEPNGEHDAPPPANLQQLHKQQHIANGNKPLNTAVLGLAVLIVALLAAAFLSITS